MNASGIFLIIAGAWVLSQALGKDDNGHTGLQRLGIGL